MNLIYKDKSIMVTNTHNRKILKYHFQKLYYAVIIKNCNRYSSIGNKQRIDVVMTDDKLNILSIKKDMHENTVYENILATTTILLPLDFFKELETNTSFSISENSSIQKKESNEICQRIKKEDTIN